MVSLIARSAGLKELLAKNSIPKVSKCNVSIKNSVSREKKIYENLVENIQCIVVVCAKQSEATTILSNTSIDPK